MPNMGKIKNIIATPFLRRKPTHYAQITLRGGLAPHTASARFLTSSAGQERGAALEFNLPKKLGISNSYNRLLKYQAIGVGDQIPVFSDHDME